MQNHDSVTTYVTCDCAELNRDLLSSQQKLHHPVHYSSKAVVPNLSVIRDWFHGKQLFCRPRGVGRAWFQDDSSALPLLCTLFLICGNLRIFHLDFRVRVDAPMRLQCRCWPNRRQSSGGNTSRWGVAINTDEASLAHLLLISWFLTGGW